MRALFTIAASALAVGIAVAAPVDYRKQIAPLAAVDGRPEEDCALRPDAPRPM